MKNSKKLRSLEQRRKCIENTNRLLLACFKRQIEWTKNERPFLHPLWDSFLYFFMHPDNCLYRYSVALGAMNEYTWHAIYEPTKMIKFEKEIFKIDLKSNMLWCIMKSELFVLLRMLTYVYIKAKSIYIPWNDAG